MHDPSYLVGATALGVVIVSGGLLFKALTDRRRSPAKPAFMDLEESADHAAQLREHMVANLRKDLAKAKKNKQAVKPIRARLLALGVGG